MMIKKLTIFVLIISSCVFASQFVVEKKKKVHVKELKEIALDTRIQVMRKLPELGHTIADLQEYLQEDFLRCAQGDKEVAFVSKKAPILEKDIAACQALLDAFDQLEKAAALLAGARG
jgi:hypothetical protein